MQRIDELKRLAEGLKTVPPEAFKMDIWTNDHPMSMTPGKFDCGFAGCAIGWMPRFVPDNGLVAPGRDPYYFGDFGYNAVANYFDIDIDTTAYLFSPERYRNKVTPTEVAERIERFIGDTP